MPSMTRPGPQVSSAEESSSGPARSTAVRRALREVALVLVLLLAYKFGRLAADGNVGAAFQNAESVWHWERMLGLPSEKGVQGVLLDHRGAIRLANGYYAWVHFPATGLFLLWLYCRRPAHYRWIRKVMTLLTGSALLLHLVAPLAPPRMLARAGMTDTAHVWGPAVYGDPRTDAAANQYAAMPSPHVGWAVVVAVALIVVLHGRRLAVAGSPRPDRAGRRGHGQPLLAGRRCCLRTGRRRVLGGPPPSVRTTPAGTTEAPHTDMRPGAQKRR